VKCSGKIIAATLTWVPKMSFDAMGRLNGCLNDSYRAFALPSPAAKQSFGPLNSAGAWRGYKKKSFAIIQRWTL
jgi:hypothetical protein